MNDEEFWALRQRIQDLEGVLVYVRNFLPAPLKDRAEAVLWPQGPQVKGHLYPANDRWLVWSVEHGAWWMPLKRGYTRSIAEAGRYSFQEATDICEHANRHSATLQETMFQAP